MNQEITPEMLRQSIEEARKETTKVVARNKDYVTIFQEEVARGKSFSYKFDTCEKALSVRASFYRMTPESLKSLVRVELEVNDDRSAYLTFRRK